MHRTLPLLALAASLTFARPAGAEVNWPEFRGPTADGHAVAAGLPVTWSEQDNIRWKTPIHDKGWSSPVIWGQQIWLTTAREDGKQLFAVCVDRETGKLIHDIKVFDVDNPAFCHPFNSYASSTPAIEEGRVYVHFGSPGTACLDTATGKVLWTRRDFPCDHFRGAGSSPILSGNLLFLIFDGYDQQYVAALDKATGKTVWKKDRNIDYTMKDADWHKAYATPALIQVQGKPQLICPSADSTMAYNPQTGAEIWRVTHGSMNVGCRPLFAHGKLYLTIGHPGKLLALRPDGTGNITASHIDWTFSKNAPTRPSPLLLKDLLFLLGDGGIVTWVEAKTGEPVQQGRLQGAFSASPIYADGKIICASQEGTIYVLEPGRDIKVLAANKLDEGCMASPVAIDKALYLRTRTHLYRIEKK